MVLHDSTLGPRGCLLSHKVPVYRRGKIASFKTSYSGATGQQRHLEELNAIFWSQMLNAIFSVLVWRWTWRESLCWGAASGTTSAGNASRFRHWIWKFGAPRSRVPWHSPWTHGVSQNVAWRFMWAPGVRVKHAWCRTANCTVSGMHEWMLGFSHAMHILVAVKQSWVKS